MSVHINLLGTWEACAKNGCALPFHLPDMNLAQVQALNPALLHELFDLEALTPGPYHVAPHLTEWRDSDGNTHRDYDLPARVYSDGSKYWYQHGQLHRDHDRPAVEYAAGNREWWQHNDVHRDGDKPAMIDADGTQTWYTNGTIGRPNGDYDMLTPYGDKQWHDADQRLHRDNNLPAVIRPDGTCEYWIHGKEHGWGTIADS